MKDFSIIVLCYNSEKKALKNTLDSILHQKDIDFEIIIADDASKNDCVSFAKQHLHKMNYNSYKVKLHEQNVGTVQNIYDALAIAEGKYVKCIGAGDLLFDEHTLCKISSFMDKEKCTMCFGKMQAYNYQNEKLNLITLTVPLDIASFYKNNPNQIKKNIIQNHGWIAGASMFYDTKEFYTLLEQLIGTIRYCEDLLQVNLLINNKKISFYPHGAIYYEVGSGISTNNANGNNNRVKNDHDRFWDMMVGKYSDNKLLQKGCIMNKLIYIPGLPKKMFSIMLKNPSYLFMCVKTKFQNKLYKINEKGMLN